MRSALGAMGALVAATAAPAQAPEPERLVVRIAVDGLSGALLNEYRPLLQGGLARSAGSVVALDSQTRAPARRIVAVSGSAAAAPTPVPAQQRWQWNGRAFSTDAALSSQPSVVGAANALVQKLVAAPESALVPPAYCEAKASAGGSRFARAAGDLAAFERSPSLDGATLALAAGLAQELRLGQGQATDLLSVRLSATGNIVRAYGSGSQETCLQLFALDRELGDFLRALDRMAPGHSIALQLAN